MMGSPAPKDGGEPLADILANERVLSGGVSAELDEDLKLAMILQEQERAFLALAGVAAGGWGGVPENLPPAGSRTAAASAAGSRTAAALPPSAAAALQADGASHAHALPLSGQQQKEETVEEEPAGAADEPVLTDEELAARLQAEEQAEFQARLLALAGVGPTAGLPETVDDDYLSDDSVDPDEMTYEQLTALGEAVGTVSRGLAPEAVAALPCVTYAELCMQRCAGAGESGGAAGGGPAPSSTDGQSQAEQEVQEEEQCPVCRLELEASDELMLLPCGHYYHPECIGEWLMRNKVCCVCNKEVAPGGAQQPKVQTAASSRACDRAPLGERGTQ